MTPFQMFLVDKLLREEKGTYTLIFIEHVGNAKNDHYYNLLSKKMNKSFRYKVDKKNPLVKFFYFFLFVFKLKRQLSSIDSIFLSTINDKHIFALLKLIEFKDIISFDDGLGNVFVDGDFFESNKRLEYIKSKISKHYTIYQGLPNIVEREKIISLDLNHNVANGIVEKDIAIFLGQPYKEFLHYDMSNEKLKEILSKFKNSSYFPHPRENVIYEGVKYINTELIFEDYIYNILVDDPLVRVSVYTFFSSAALNVVGYDRVKVFSLSDERLRNKYKKLYDIFSEKGVINLEWRNNV